MTTHRTPSSEIMITILSHQCVPFHLLPPPAPSAFSSSISACFPPPAHVPLALSSAHDPPTFANGTSPYLLSDGKGFFERCPEEE